MAMQLTRLTTEDILTLAQQWNRYPTEVGLMIDTLRNGDRLNKVLLSLPPAVWIDIIDQTLMVLWDGGLSTEVSISDFMSDVLRYGSAVATLYDTLCICGFIAEDVHVDKERETASGDGR